MGMDSGDRMHSIILFKGERRKRMGRKSGEITAKIELETSTHTHAQTLYTAKLV